MKIFERAFVAAFLFLSILPGIQIGFAEDIQLQVIVQKTSVRAKPDLASEIFTQVSLGTVLTSDMRGGNWFRIHLPPYENGVRRGAFIHSSIVEVITTTKEPAQKTEVKKKKVDEKIPALSKKNIA